MSWCGDIFLALVGHLSINLASCKLRSWLDYCCWPCPSFCDQSTHLLMAASYREMCHIILYCFLERDNELTVLRWPPQLPDFNDRALLGSGRAGVSHHECAADKSPASMSCHPVNMDQKYLKYARRTFFNLRHEELRQFLRQKGVQHSISKMYTIKWPYTILYHYWQSLIKLNNKFISSCEIKKFSNYDPMIKYVHKCSILHIEYFNLNNLRMILGYNCCSIATGRLWLLLKTVM